MKFLRFYRFVFAAIAFSLPIGLSAMENANFDKPVKRRETDFSELFQDSIPKRKPETKNQEPVEKPPQDIHDDRIREPERRAIKQVPRSIPKLKPQPVGERIRIQRPPIKIPKKGFGPHGF